MFNVLPVHLRGQGKKKSDSSKSNSSAAANAPDGVGAATSAAGAAGAGGPVIVGDMRDDLDDGVNQSSGGCKCAIM